MTIDKIFKIKEKYFNAILRFEKPFELRHEKVEPNSIIKLECENGRYLIFRSSKCAELVKVSYSDDCWIYCYKKYSFYKYYATESDYYDEHEEKLDWYDAFCWNYINKAPTYLIEIAELLEVK